MPDKFPSELLRTENKLSENSVCVWKMQKKLSDSFRLIFPLKNVAPFVEHLRRTTFTPERRGNLFIVKTYNKKFIFFGALYRK